MFSIELLVSAIKGSNNGINEFIKLKSDECNCLSYAYFDELNYYKNKVNIEMIHQITFTSKSCDDILEFINSIKFNKHIYIDCVYRNEHSNNKILYASKNYCKLNLDKRNRREYVKNETFTDDENIILNALCTTK